MIRLLTVLMFAWLRGTRGLVINAPSKLGKKSTAADVIATIKPDLSGKVAIVTGGNSGIGVETVKALASAKCKVILACRNVAAGKAAREDMYTRYDIDVEELDLNDLASVKRFADRVATVDLLVLNAGIMALNKKRTHGRRVRETNRRESLRPRVPHAAPAVQAGSQRHGNTTVARRRRGVHGARLRRQGVDAAGPRPRF